MSTETETETIRSRSEGYVLVLPSGDQRGEHCAVKCRKRVRPGGLILRQINHSPVGKPCAQRFLFVFCWTSASYKMEIAVALLKKYAGRDKIMRTVCYTSLMLSGPMRGKIARDLTVLAKQISTARMISRLFEDLPSWVTTFGYGLGEYVS